ncbi:MAG: hypothetical protein HY291_04785 [Planctomycetes bacterium]|nr:hypothetical protein [Planctomycetota bacterium]
MAEVAYWEKLFVEAYIVKSKRERYLAFLKGRKHRKKILERLNHSLDYDESKACLLDAPYRAVDSLISLLRRHYVADTCYLVADGNRFDGRELRLELAVPELLQNSWGALIICPLQGKQLLGTPIAVYKEEDPGDVILLSGGSAR